MTIRPQLILLHEADTILICASPIRRGDRIEIDGMTSTARETIDVGHKVARSELGAGDKVIKYGAPIGSMTAPVLAGGWVHLHNMKSDYIASHSRRTVGLEEL